MRCVGRLPNGPEKARLVRDMFDRIAPRYDLVNRVMTFGMDIRWRRKAVRALDLPPGSAVVDVACGTGDLCCELRAQGHRPVGVDISWGMLQAARRCGPLVQGDGLALPVRTGGVDGITCGFALRNVTDLARLLEEFARALRPVGRLAVLEVAEPSSRIARAGHDLYFRRAVPLIGRALSDKDAYEYLPRSTAYLPAPGKLAEMLRAVGFENVQREPLAMGAAQLIMATRRRRPFTS